MKRNENVIVILIGAKDTRLLINNTLNTLKSYENISQRNGKTLVMKYLQNESSAKRHKVDEEIRFLISGLCMLFSGQNKGLDSKDLEHWINFNKVTTYEPQMVSLETVESLEDIQSGGNIVSVATVAPIDGDTDLSRPVEVQFIGYVPEDMPEPSKNRLPIHFVTTDGIFEEVGTQLKDALEELNARAKARVKRESLLTEDDQETDNGLIL